MNLNISPEEQIILLKGLHNRLDKIGDDLKTTRETIEKSLSYTENVKTVLHQCLQSLKQEKTDTLALLGKLQSTK